MERKEEMGCLNYGTLIKGNAFEFVKIIYDKLNDNFIEA